MHFPFSSHLLQLLLKYWQETHYKLFKSFFKNSPKIKHKKYNFLAFRTCAV